MNKSKQLREQDIIIQIMPSIEVRDGQFNFGIVGLSKDGCLYELKNLVWTKMVSSPEKEIKAND